MRGSVEDSAEPRFLAVGRVSKPHGVRGEVRVEPYTDDPERFRRLKHIYVGETDPRQEAVEAVRFHQGMILLKLKGLDTRDDVEALRGQWLMVPREEAVPLEEGEYYLYQLEGMNVYTESGRHLGRLTEILETGANNVFVVTGEQGQVLLPDISDVVLEIDVAGKRMVVRPLPGLLRDGDD